MYKLLKTLMCCCKELLKQLKMKFINRKRNCKSWFWPSFALCFAITTEFLIPPHPLTNFEIQIYYDNKSRFNGVYSRNNLLKKINDEAYVINLDKHADTGTHWIALFCSRNEIVYFDCFGVEHIPEDKS